MFSKGGKDSDATISRKFTKEGFLEREQLLKEKLFGKSDREKRAENQARKSRAASAWRDSVSGFGRDFRQASFLRERFPDGGRFSYSVQYGKGMRESIRTPSRTRYPYGQCPKEATSHYLKMSKLRAPLSSVKMSSDIFISFSHAHCLR